MSGPQVHELPFANGVAVREPILAQPGQHYSMGVYAAASGRDQHPKSAGGGECSNVSVQGANRLAETLLETVVFGKRATESYRNRPGYRLSKGRRLCPEACSNRIELS